MLLKKNLNLLGKRVSKMNKVQDVRLKKMLKMQILKNKHGSSYSGPQIEVVGQDACE